MSGCSLIIYNKTDPKKTRPWLSFTFLYPLGLGLGLRLERGGEGVMLQFILVVFLSGGFLLLFFFSISRTGSKFQIWPHIYLYPAPPLKWRKTNINHLTASLGSLKTLWSHLWPDYISIVIYGDMESNKKLRIYLKNIQKIKIFL